MLSCLKVVEVDHLDHLDLLGLLDLEDLVLDQDQQIDQNQNQQN
jgi:hypothetical protein